MRPTSTARRIDAGEFAREVSAHGYLELPVTAEHAGRVQSLPAHHGDPFDRILIAQALLEGATLLAHDQQLAACLGPIGVCWVVPAATAAPAVRGRGPVAR